MREILFRGKTIKSMWADSEWVYGSLVIDGDNAFIVTENDYSNSYTDDRGVYDGDMTKVDITTVEQYTGLTDKNGKKIFEGDIVTTDIERPYLIVEFRDGCFMFNCNDGGKDYYDIMLPIVDEPHTEYKYGEVIGNIHDNPELLRTSQNDEVK